MIMIDIVDEYSSQPKHVGGSELGIRSYRIGAHDPAFEAARRYHQDLVQMAGRASQISKVPMGKAAAAIPAVSRIAINPGLLQIARRCVEMLENLLSHLSARVSVLSRVLRKER